MTNSDFYQQPTKPNIPPEEAVSNILRIPETIGPYRVETLLEKGGMSILYLSSHPETHAPTTIKVLSPKFASHPEIVERFLREAEIIALADHPNIVKLYGQGKWEEGLYIAMEFIQGISLRQYILQTPISLKRALEIIIDIAYALCHLHTHGVIHRDLKPENILVTETGAIKVIDFGIAQLLTETTSDMPKQQRVIGTPIYMSPEQRENPEAVSFPSDIYSLGIIAYELMLGKLSHGQIHLSLMPKGMQKILVKALQPNVNDRYLDIVDFIVDVSAYLNSEAYEKDKIVRDHLSELSEGLRLTQSLFNKEKTLNWPELNIKVSTSSSYVISNTYHDFLDMGLGKYGIVLAETSLKSSAGLVVCSIFRGMFRALYNVIPNLSELATVLNQSMIHDGLDKDFRLNYLVIDTIKNEVQYLVCGQSYLWIKHHHKEFFKTICENPPLGQDFHAKFTTQKIEWKNLDSLILSNAGQKMSEADLLDIWQSSSTFNPQVWMEIFMRKYKTAHKVLPETSIALISIQNSNS